MCQELFKNFSDFSSPIEVVISNFDLSSCFYVLFFPRRKKRTKRTPLGDGEVSLKQKQLSIKNNQTVRLLLDFNISPSPKTLPPLRAHLRCARAWGSNTLKGKSFSRPSNCSRDLNKNACLIGEADLSRRESALALRYFCFNKLFFQLPTAEERDS